MAKPKAAAPKTTKTAPKTTPKTTQKSAAPAKKKSSESVFDMALADLESGVAQMGGIATEIETHLPGLVSLSPDARKRSQGKLRGGEDQALLAIFQTAQAHPDFFDSLGGEDFGQDPGRFESDVLIERLGRFAALVRARQTFAPAFDRLDDSILQLGEQLRVPAGKAYKIAQALAASNPKIRTSLAPATEFYGAVGRKAAATRKKTKAGDK
jgi:hypothetical protein